MILVYFYSNIVTALKMSTYKTIVLLLRVVIRKAVDLVVRGYAIWNTFGRLRCFHDGDTPII